MSMAVIPGLVPGTHDAFIRAVIGNAVVAARICCAMGPGHKARDDTIGLGC
jgi:hypothetical protein